MRRGLRGALLVSLLIGMGAGFGAAAARAGEPAPPPDRGLASPMKREAGAAVVCPEPAVGPSDRWLLADGGAGGSATPPDSVLDDVNRGIQQYQGGNWSAAVEFLTRSLAGLRQAGDKSLEWKVLYFIGTACRNLGRSDRAIGYYEQALAVEREVTQTIEREARECASHGNFLGQALALERAVKVHADEGRTLDGLGQAYYLLSQYDRAIGYFKQALAVERSARDRAGEGMTLGNLGVACDDLSQYERAITYYEQALAIQREVKDRGGEGRTLSNLGLSFDELGRYDEAVGVFEQARAIERALKDRAGEATTLSNLGLACSHLSQVDKAMGYYEQALAIERELHDRRHEEATLSNLGIGCGQSGEYARAIEFFQQALAIDRDIKDRSGEGTDLNNLGLAYSKLSQYEKAIAYYEQALAIKREVKDRAGEGAVLNNLGDASAAARRYDVAVGYYGQALALVREVGDRAGAAVALSNLGLVYNDLRQYDKAIGYYEQALAIEREVKDRADEGVTLGNLGLTYDHLRQFHRATEFYGQALAIDREVKDRAGEGTTLHNLMALAEERSHPLLAILYGKLCINAWEEIRGNIAALSRESRRAFLKSHESDYHRLADLLVDQGRLAEAEQVIALLKDEEYKKAVRGVQSTPGQPVALTTDETKLAKQYDDVLGRLGSVSAEYDALAKLKQRTTDQDRQMDALDDQLQTARKVFREFLAGLEHDTAAPQFDAGRIQSLANDQNLQGMLRQVAEPSVILYTLVGSDRVYVILMTPNLQEAFATRISLHQLYREIEAFRQCLKSPSVDPRPAGRALYEVLLGARDAKQGGLTLARQLAQLHPKVLMWELDGRLRYVPVAALSDGRRYLAEAYRNVVFTPASNVNLNHIPQPSGWHALGLGVSRAESAPVDGSPHQFPALTSVPRELSSVIRGADSAGGVLPGKILLDSAFTADAMRHALRSGYQVVHIASHFVLDPTAVDRSFLLVGAGSPPALYLDDMNNWTAPFQSVDLLTLSACDTAMGGDAGPRNGKEVENFAVAAQNQGARAVLATLWEVDDASTAAFMRAFYGALQSGKMSKADALQAAQLALLHAGAAGGAARRGLEPAPNERGAPPFQTKHRWAHPYFWAPFILLGNWR